MHAGNQRLAEGCSTVDDFHLHWTFLLGYWGCSPRLHQVRCRQSRCKDCQPCCRGLCVCRNAIGACCGPNQNRRCTSGKGVFFTVFLCVLSLFLLFVQVKSGCCGRCMMRFGCVCGYWGAFLGCFLCVIILGLAPAIYDMATIYVVAPAELPEHIDVRTSGTCDAPGSC